MNVDEDVPEKLDYNEIQQRYLENEIHEVRRLVYERDAEARRFVRWVAYCAYIAVCAYLVGRSHGRQLVTRVTRNQED